MITNTGDVSLTLAVWLLHDEYDYIDKPNYISATTLMKPLRPVILAGRLAPEERVMDVSDFTARALGHSIHDSVEKAWTRGHRRALKLLGYPDALIERIRVNPEPADLEQAAAQGLHLIPVYLEQRAFREVTVAGVIYTVGGKFDFAAEGIVQDIKSTSAYTWVGGGKDDDYKLQMSLYRWLNPTKITEDYGRINFVFTDWQKAQARSNPKYPQSRVLHKDIPLMSLAETEAWVVAKLGQHQTHRNTPEDRLPRCTDEELWRSDPKYRYFTNPEKTDGRATRVFDNPVEARSFMVEKGGKGVIVTTPGEPKRCGYCDAYSLCTQKDAYFHD